MEKISLREFNPDGVTGNGDKTDMFYRFYITGPQGAKFELWREKHHTDDDVGLAKRWIRQNHDVVHMAVLHDDGIEEMSLETYIKQEDPKDKVRVILKDEDYKRSMSYAVDRIVCTTITINHYPQYTYVLWEGQGYLYSRDGRASVFYIPKLKIREEDVRKLDNAHK